MLIPQKLDSATSLHPGTPAANVKRGLHIWQKRPTRDIPLASLKRGWEVSLSRALCLSVFLARSLSLSASLPTPPLCLTHFLSHSLTRPPSLPLCISPLHGTLRGVWADATHIRVYVHMHVCKCICTCMYVQLGTYKCMYSVQVIHTLARACTNAHAYVRICTHTHVHPPQNTPHTHVNSQYLPTNISIYTYVHVSVCISADVLLMCVLARVCVLTNTH